MKKIFGLIFSFFIIAGCDDNKKVIPYLKEKKEVSAFINESFVPDFSFLFIIDTSGSVTESEKEFLANNVSLFFQPIFEKYTYINYHIGFTTMSPKDYYEDNLPLNATESKCEGSNIKKSNIGTYLSYSHSQTEFNPDTLNCLLKENIKNIEGGGDTERYFDSIDHILENLDNQFKKDFFGKDKFLTLFFISDHPKGEGGDYDKRSHGLTDNKDKETIGEEISNEYIDKFKKVFDFSIRNKNIEQKLKVYGAIPDDREILDTNCVEGRGYPYHVYKFIEKTKGHRFSVCDEIWTDNIKKVSDDFLSSIKIQKILLDDIPKIDSLEVYVNEIEIPRDLKEGWFLDPETLSINLGSEFDWSYYLTKTFKNISETKITIRYYPLNPKILQEGKKR